MNSLVAFLRGIGADEGRRDTTLGPSRPTALMLDRHITSDGKSERGLARAGSARSVVHNLATRCMVAVVDKRKTEEG